MESAYHVRYTVLDCAAMVEYIRRNFAITPDDRRTTDHPRAKEALYLIDDGSLAIQVTELQEPKWDIIRHLAEQGPGVYHTELLNLKIFPVEQDDEYDEFEGLSSQLVAAPAKLATRLTRAKTLAAK